MTVDVGSYTDAFKGTAYYYARYRPGYPAAFFDFVAEAFGIDGRGRLLDLGCGTGQIAVPFADRFEEVVAMDPEAEMLAELRRGLGAKGTGNITLVQGSSADLSSLMETLGTFRLVTMGNSFHWMDRVATLDILAQMVEPGGGVVVVGASTGGSFWTSPLPWCRTVKATIQKWLGEERRAGSGTFSARVTPERHEDFIDRSAFGPCQIRDLTYQRTWLLDEIIGNLYSTSFCSPHLLGERRGAFEADLRRALLEHDPSGRYVEDVQLEILWGVLKK